MNTVKTMFAPDTKLVDPTSPERIKDWAQHDAMLRLRQKVGARALAWEREMERGRRALGLERAEQDALQQSLLGLQARGYPYVEGSPRRRPSGLGRGGGRTA